MSGNFVQLIFLMVITDCAIGQLQLAGVCDESVPVVTPLDLTLYSGVWYEVARLGVQSNDSGICVREIFTTPSASNATINYLGVYNGVLETSNGNIAFTNTSSDEGRLTLAFNTISATGVASTVYTPYWVIATDYYNYALLYSCVSFDSTTKIVSSWQLSRSNQLTVAAQASIQAAVDSVTDLQNTTYYQVDQSDANCLDQLFETASNNATSLIVNSGTLSNGFSGLTIALLTCLFSVIMVAH